MIVTLKLYENKNIIYATANKNEVYWKNFSSKCDENRIALEIRLIENFNFCVVDFFVIIFSFLFLLVKCSSYRSPQNCQNL